MVRIKNPDIEAQMFDSEEKRRAHLINMDAGKIWKDVTDLLEKFELARVEPDEYGNFRVVITNPDVVAELGKRILLRCEEAQKKRKSGSGNRSTRVQRNG